MEKIDIRTLRKGMYLWDTRHKHCVEVYGQPYELERPLYWHKESEWAITTYLYGKPKKNRNKKIILEDNIGYYIIVANPEAARILYG